MATFRFHGPRLVAFATLATAGSFARAPAMQFDTTERISVDSAGNQNTSHARGTRISADGSRVAYWARQGSLVPDDGNNADDVFVSDRRTGVTRRVSISSSGVAGNGASAPTSLSADGRYIVFDSSASNLVPGDTNAQTDVFLHDVNTGTTTRVSTTSSGVEGNGFSVLGSISADGRFVAFETNSTNFLGDGLPGGTVVVDRQTGAMTRASVSTGGAWGYGARPAISGDGRFVAFDSGSTSLVDGDTNAQIDVFVHDRQTGITRRVSVSSTGEQLLTSCFTPSISFDGQRVAFHTNSSFVPNQPYGVVMHDMETGATTQVSVTTGGTAVLGALPVISSDGTFIAFESSNANIDPADSGSVIDIFLYEVATGAVRRVDASSFGVPAWSHCHEAALSGDGRAVAFWSGATNLVTADTNGADDVFVHETVDASIASFCFGDGQRAPCPCANDSYPGSGCGNSIWIEGGFLRATGTPSVAADTLSLRAERMSGNTCVFFQGTATIAPLAIDDGLGCVGGTLLRLGTKSVASTTARYPQSGDLAVSVKGAIGAAGGTRHYQAFYRNADPSFCTSATTNRSSGLSIAWAP